MSGQEEARKPPRRGARIVRTIALSTLILGLAVGGVVVAFSTEPKAKRDGATKQTAMLVEVTAARVGSYRPTIVATGTVEPEQDVVLRPQVAGEVVKRAEEFTPGEVVEEGQTLLWIQPADYRNALAQRKSELQQTLSELALERGRQSVARKEFELFQDNAASGEKSLVLRKPQLDAAETRVEAARAAVEQAELDLQRTRVVAPFDALVLQRDVNLGSLVSRGDSLGRLLGLDTYWVAATVPMAKLRWIALPQTADERGADVELRNTAAWPEGVSRTGRVHKVIGALDDRTRMARLLIAVSDPLARAPDAGTATPKLMVGEFLEARIRGNEIANVVRLPRAHVRDGDTVWVMQEQTLRIRKVGVVMRDAEHAYIADGLTDGELVVTTNLATVTDGAKLRLKTDAEQPAR